MHLERALVQLRGRLARRREELRIAEEQILFQRDVVDDAETRMVVSETPLADREYRDARDDLVRLERHRDKVTAEIAELRREQDRLLDRMLAPRP